MTEVEQLPEDFFGPSKKKKKKKTVFGEGIEDVAPVETLDVKPEAEVKVAVDEIVDDDFSLMKKKKKKKTTFESDLNDIVDETTGGDFDFDGKKKKKKPLVFDVDSVAGENGFDGAEEDEGVKFGGEDGHALEKEAWVDSDRDYSYDELLNRIFETMRQRNPDMVAGERRVIMLRAPNVSLIGSKRTGFSNFMDFCQTVRRKPEHVLAFLMAELGTSGSIDGKNQLTIKGRFTAKQIEKVLRKYILEYVTCHTCRSPSTILTKEDRLSFLQCESCGAQCSVAAIQSGFQAVTGKRAKMRS